MDLCTKDNTHIKRDDMYFGPPMAGVLRDGEIDDACGAAFDHDVVVLAKAQRRGMHRERLCGWVGF
jgi:hypothetical protein